MIRSFRHPGLQALYEGTSARYLAPSHVEKLGDILAVLDASYGPSDMNIHSLRLHPLKGRLKGFWAVSVSGNWR
jgi:proteic killer suppression protein